MVVLQSRGQDYIILLSFNEARISGCNIYSIPPAALFVGKINYKSLRKLSHWWPYREFDKHVDLIHKSCTGRTLRKIYLYKCGSTQ